MTCEACGASTEYRVWGHAVCSRCLVEWEAHTPDFEELALKFGDWDTPALRVFYRVLTDLWVQARKGRTA